MKMTRYYRTCAVPLCKNTSKTCPNKLFIHVPFCPKRRKQWLQLAGRDPKLVSNKSSLFYCEDHFDLPNDMENYIKYNVMGYVSRIRMKPNCLPSLFECQSNRIKHTMSTQPQSAVSKRQHMDLIQEIFSGANEVPATSGMNGSSNTMIEDANESEAVKEEMHLECRACLQMFNSDTELYYIFQAWAPPWEGIDNTIAETLEKVTQIQVSDMDKHSKVICEACCEKLHSAYLFMMLVQQSDHILRQRCEPTSVETRTNVNSNSVLDTRWPKPIQVEKIVPIECAVEFEIKKEVLTDEETDYPAENVTQTQMAEMEIKIEPEEILPQLHSKVLNGHYGGSGSGDPKPDLPTLNGEDSSLDSHNISIKEEPMSDSESAGTDMSLDCMLCTKVFKSVSGLKAHVIAQHSYKTVRRKAAHEVSPKKISKNEYVCATCRRSFTTSTDLMVHETCHKKCVCYGCSGKFDTFQLLNQHQSVCKAVNTREHGPVKTLEDVQRPPRPAADDKNERDVIKCAHCEETFTDNYYMSIHLEVQHREPQPALSEEMEVEALESLFSERA